MGLDLHDNTPPNMMSLFENVLYACCKRQKLKHPSTKVSNLRHVIASLKSLLCLLIGSATLLSPERYLCPSVQLKQFRKSSEKTAKLPAACGLLSYISLPSLFPFFWRFSAQSIHQFAALSWTLQMPQMKHLLNLLCTTRFISLPFNSRFLR